MFAVEDVSQLVIAAFFGKVNNQLEQTSEKSIEPANRWSYYQQAQKKKNEQNRSNSI